MMTKTRFIKHISLNSSSNEKYFRKKFTENQNTRFVFNFFFVGGGIVPFIRQCGKIWYSRTNQRRQYGASAFHAGYLRLQTHTQNL